MPRRLIPRWFARGSTPDHPTRWWWAVSRWILRATLLSVLALWSIALVGWLTLHWGILPHIDEWRPQIQERASRALGLPVAIGKITVQSPGWVPALELRDVVLSDREGREALRLPRVSAALSPKSLLGFKLVFSQLYIEGAELEVRRDAQGRLHVAGLDMDAAAPVDDGGGLDWLLDQPEFVLRHGTLRWVDQQRAAPPLVLSDADLVLRSGLKRHELRLDATPGGGLGERFTVAGRFVQPLLARSGDWARWSGTLYAELPSADMARLRAHVSLPFELQAGTGAARAWLDFSNGQWRRATLDAALDAAQLKLGPALEPLVLQRLQGRFEAERSNGELRLSARRLHFATAEAAWPASQLSLRLAQRQRLNRPGWSDLPVTGGEFSADRLDLALMAQVAERLPLPANIRRALDELAPQGVVQGLQASWTGAVERPAHYRVKGRVGGLTIAALPAPPDAAASGARAPPVGRPGWRGADLELDASESGGEARLVVHDGALELPGVFADPVLPLSQFTGRLVWQIQPQKAAAGAAPLPPAIDLRLVDAQFANADARGELQLRWRTGPGAGRGKGGRYPGIVDVTGRIDQGRATSVARYLPAGLPHTRDYLAGAIQSGTVRNARLRLRGDLAEFPFAQPGKAKEGEFLVTTQAEDLSFAYVPPVLTGGVARWPEFTQVHGELVFDRGAMRIRNARAKLWGIELKGVNGEIADLAHDPALVIGGGGRGPLTDALRFVGATPIDTWTSHALKEATGTGQADLQLALRIPLNDAAHTTVRGSVTLAGNEVRLRPDIPVLSGARTRIDFSQSGFSIQPGTARALGGELAFDGGLGPDGVVRFNAQGTASAEGLRQAPELGSWVPRLAGAMNGQSPYKLQVAVRQGHPELLITSPLTGMALDLPAPFAKPAAAAWPLRIQTQLLPAAGEATAARDQLHVELGGVLQAGYLRELLPEGARVLRGALAIGDAPMPSLPTSGVSAAVQVAQLSGDAWQALLHPAGGGAQRPPEPASGYLPTEASLRAQALTLGGRHFGALQASLQRRGQGEAEAWRLLLSGDAVQGQLDWRPAGAGAPWPRWQARLARLSVPSTEPGAPEPARAAARPAETPPALDVVIDELTWRGRKLGRLELEGRPADGGAPRDWRLARLVLAAPDARLVGSGQWAAARQRMALELKLEVADAGAMLERLDFGKQMRHGKGQVQGQFSWTGAALVPDWDSFDGGARLNLDAGQFLKAEPGAARLLGVLSLQALPRRLTLDFRDVFQQGFAFDNFAGDIALHGGVASTNNLRIRGVQAAVLIEGLADLKKETQDLRMVVVPEINAGTASLAYAAINPAIGLGTFLAQLFLRKPLMQAGTREFRVTGGWGDPQVEPVARADDAPLPEMEEPPAAAAASAPLAR
ncbi:MAG: YhdP family protein [Pseudomonadota bacterium]